MNTINSIRAHTASADATAEVSAPLTCSCRLLSVGDKPGHDFFRLLAQKLEEYQVPMPTVQIEYKNLTVKTQAMVGNAGIPTAGNFGPQLLKVSKAHLKRITHAQQQTQDSSRQHHMFAYSLQESTFSCT
jgi:hypothetical protein